MAEQEVLDDDEIVFEKDGELKEAENKIGELLKNKERSPEEEQELKELKAKRQGRYNERLNQFSNERKQAKHEAQQERERAEKLRQELEDLRKEKNVSPKVGAKEQLTINGKKFYTDRSLGVMVSAGEMSQDDAWQHQQERIEEKAVERLKQERVKEEQQTQHENDIRWILNKYPKFNPNHADHNPDDPIFKESQRLISNGYRSYKVAVEEAEERIGKKKDGRPDLSEELSIRQNNESGAKSNRQKIVELSEQEQEQAYRFYVLGGKQNPVSQKTYTRSEAIAKALKVKQERVQAAR